MLKLIPTYASNSFNSISFHCSIDSYILASKFIDLLYLGIKVFIFVLLYIRTYLFDCRSIELIGNSFIAYFVNILYEPILVIVLYTFHLIGLFISYRMQAQFNASIDLFLEFLSKLWEYLHRYFIGRISKFHRFIHIPFHRSRPQVIFFSSPPSQMRAFLF